MKDDSVYILLLGVLIGLPIGVFLYKQLFEKSTTTTAKIYGAQYAYDANGRLTSYIPTPIPTGE